MYWFTPLGVLKGRVSIHSDSRFKVFSIPVGQRVFDFFEYVDLQSQTSTPLGFVFNVSPISAGDGLLYFGNNNSQPGGRPFAVEPASLSRDLVAGISSPLDSQAMAADGTLYIPQDQTLTALNSITKTTNWVFDTEERRAEVFAPNIAEDGTVLFFANRTLYAVKGTASLGNGWWPKIFCDAGNSGCQESSAPRITRYPAILEFQAGQPAVFNVEAFGPGSLEVIHGSPTACPSQEQTLRSYRLLRPNPVNTRSSSAIFPASSRVALRMLVTP